MARPQKHGMDYFPHDTDASSDEKIEILRALYGNDGYVFYFILLERIYRTENFELDLTDYENKLVLANKIGVHIDKFEQMLATSIKKNYFDSAHFALTGHITNNGVKKRSNVVLSKRKKQKDRYEEKVSDIVSVAETTQITPQKVHKGKESKGKESKEKINDINIGRFTPPTIEEIKAYCLERKNAVDPQRFIDFYEAKGWMVGKNKMKNWQASVRTWEGGNNQSGTRASPQQVYIKPNRFNNFEQETHKMTEGHLAAVIERQRIKRESQKT